MNRLRCDLGPDTFTCEYFEKNGMGYSTVDDMGFADAASECIQARMYLGQHPFSDRALLHHPLHIFAGDRREMVPIRAANAFHVGHHHQLFRTKRSSHRPGHQIGIDIVGIPFSIGTDRRDDRDVMILLKFPHQRGID